jgi:Fe2+ or Zn2+ uptake regulation protein
MARRTNPNQPMLTRFSAALTSRGRLLEVVLAIDPSKAFCATALQAQLEDAGVDKISKELRQLEEMGLVEEIESETATVDFRITDRKAWQALRTLAECARQESIVVP